MMFREKDSNIKKSNAERKHQENAERNNKNILRKKKYCITIQNRAHDQMFEEEDS